MYFGGVLRVKRSGRRVGIEEEFFPRRARKGAAVLTSRTLFGVTGLFFFCVGMRNPGAKGGVTVPRELGLGRIERRGLFAGHGVY